MITTCYPYPIDLRLALYLYQDYLMLLLTLADLTVLPIAATAVCASVHMPALIGTALSAFKIELLLDMPTLADVFSGNISSWRDERIRPAKFPSSPARTFPISQYLREPASGVWALQFCVLTSPRA